jgi:hypothetical protein
MLTLGPRLTFFCVSNHPQSTKKVIQQYIDKKYDQTTISSTNKIEIKKIKYQKSKILLKKKTSTFHFMVD